MGWALATFMLASLVAVASPGPAFIAISHAALNRSKHEAFVLGLGLASIATFWCALALFGLSAVFFYLPWLYSAMKLAGGAYLIFLAFKIWRGATNQLSETPNQPKHGMRAFISGCTINLTNPKAVLFAGAVLMAIFPSDMTLAQKLLILSILITIEISFYSSLVFWLSRPAARNAYLNLKRWTDRSAAAVLGALGITFLLSRP
ncbi:MAG: LysE family transporter [Rhodobacteraceae bacterium]|nr:LysE family transporter [Paracoccaceae bacterium]